MLAHSQSNGFWLSFSEAHFKTFHSTVWMFALNVLPSRSIISPICIVTIHHNSGLFFGRVFVLVKWKNFCFSRVWNSSPLVTVLIWIFFFLGQWALLSGDIFFLYFFHDIVWQITIKHVVHDRKASRPPINSHSTVTTFIFERNVPIENSVEFPIPMQSDEVWFVDNMLSSKFTSFERTRDITPQGQVKLYFRHSANIQTGKPVQSLTTYAFNAMKMRREKPNKRDWIALFRTVTSNCASV